MRLRDLASASPTAAIQDAVAAPPLDYSSDDSSSDSSFDGHEAHGDSSESDETDVGGHNEQPPSWVAAGACRVRSHISLSCALSPKQMALSTAPVRVLLSQGLRGAVCMSWRARLRADLEASTHDIALACTAIRPCQKLSPP